MSIEQLGEPEDVATTNPRGPLARLLLSLLGIGLLIGVLIAVGAIVVNSVARTEAGLCRVTAFPCTSLGVGGVELLAGVDLPAGATVTSAYATEGDSPQFRAEVLLPAGERSTLEEQFFPIEEQPAEFAGFELSDAEYWQRASTVGSGSIVAANGTRADGRVVLLFELRAP